MSDEIQLSFGWGEQAACLLCKQAFLVSYVSWLQVENFGAGVFGSAHFCSRKCAEAFYRQKEENDHDYREKRRKWG